MNLPPMTPKEQLELYILNKEIQRMLEEEYFFTFLIFAASFFNAMFALESLDVCSIFLG